MLTALQNLAPLKRPQFVGAAASYDYEETFNGTGYDLGGWTEATATVDEDYTPALEGAASLNCVSGGIAYLAITATDNCYVYFQMQIDAWDAFDTFMRFNDSFSTRASVRLNSSGSTWRAIHGTDFDDSTSSFSTSTHYHVWVEYEKGTGSDGVIRLYVSTSAGSKTLEATASAGTSTTSVDRIYFQGTGTGDIVFDSLKIDLTNPIPANP